MKKLVIASNNPGKLLEIQALLAPLAIEVVTQASLHISEVVEPHCTFIENALAKARHASLHSGLPALADDSGLCVDALDGKPGVLSARFAGLPKSDEHNNQALLNALAKQSNRTAYYYCALVLVRRHDDPQPIIAEGSWHGEILNAPRGSNGFGYDPLFLDVQLRQTGAELAPDIKNRISHRGLALQQLISKIKVLQL